MTEPPPSTPLVRGPAARDGAPGRRRAAARARRADRFALAALAALAGSACGGKVVVDEVTPPDGAQGPTSGAGGSTPDPWPSNEGGAPPIPPLVEHDLGEIAAGSTVAVEIPWGTLGFTAIAARTTPAPSFDPIGIKDIVGPDGSKLVSDYGLPGTSAYFYNRGIGAAAVPQTSAAAAMPLMPGTYRITMGDRGSGFLGGSARLTVWRRQTMDGRFHGGRLDVNAFIAGDAVSERYMREALRAAYDGFAGLRLGTVTVHHLGQEWSWIDEGLLPYLLEQTAGAPGRPALNVIAVSFFGNDLDGVAGVTPSAPSVALEHGTHLSGIAVTLSGDASLDTVVLRHELGHFAGLLHTTEIEPDLGDALDDTARCADVLSRLDSCPDYRNMMFPIGGDRSMTLTPQQLTVLQASTFYRGVVAEGGGAAAPLEARPGAAADGSAPASPWDPRPASGAPAPQPGGSHAWTAALPPRAAALLAGHFCGHSVRAGASYSALLDAAGGLDADQLLAVGRDASAPMHVRARALAAAGRAKPAPHVVAALEGLATDPVLPRAARLGAIEGVASASPAAARALAVRLTADADPVVERAAMHAVR